MAYLYDVFLSYPRHDPVLTWVREHFKPQLEQWLSLYRPHFIFRDQDNLAEGTTWPLALRKGLLESRILIAIFSPSYFQREWCRAELQSMLKREERLGFRTQQNPDGLIYPVCFHDGENFPPYVAAIQQKDLRPWNSTAPAFRQTIGYVEFENKMKEVADAVAKMVASAPAWEDDWPVVIPASAPAIHVEVQRL